VQKKVCKQSSIVLFLILFSLIFFHFSPVQSTTTPLFYANYASIPSIDIPVVSGTDAPRLLTYYGGEQISPILQKDFTKDNLHLYIRIEYSVSYVTTITKANELFNNSQDYLHSDFVDRIVSNKDYTIYDNNIQEKTKSLIYQTSPQSDPHPACFAYLLNQDPATPNFVYRIDIYGNGFDSSSNLLNIVNSVKSHCEDTILIVKAQLGENTNQTLTPTPIKTPTSTFKDTFQIQSLTGEVHIQRGGTGPWIPATKEMKLYPYDAIKVGNNIESFVCIGFENSSLPEEYRVYIGNNTTVLLSSEDARQLRVLRPEVLSISDFDKELLSRLHIFSAEFYKHSQITIITPDSIIKDTQTEFDILVSHNSTIVGTYEGTVEVSDLNNTQTVTVASNQISTVMEGQVPSQPLQFDSTQIDKWWETANSLDSNTPVISPDLDQNNHLNGIINSLFPFIVVVVGIVIVVLVFAFLRRRRKNVRNLDSKDQDLIVLPPPPPPPPPPQG
jgi:hypothetical protein